MKQLLQGSGSGETRVVDVPAPGVRPGYVLVRTVASLISVGTERSVVEFTKKSLLQKAQARPDLVKKVISKVKTDGVLTTVQATRSRLAQPMALGYSAAGVVLEVGEGVAGIQVGDRVACAGGGYAVHAEVLCVPKNLVAVLPHGVDFQTAAFTTVGAIGLHGLRLGEPQLGESVAVIGLGLIGLLTVQMAVASGCRVLGIDLDPRRAQLAKELGAHRVATIGGEGESPEAAALELSAGRGIDVALICASTSDSAPVVLAGELCRDRGRVVAVGAVGMDIPRRTFYEKELDFKISRSYGPGRYDPTYEEQGVDYPAGYVRWTQGRNLGAFLQLAADGRLKTEPLITHTFRIEDAEDAYALISDMDGEPPLAVLLEYGDEDGHRPGALARSVRLDQERPPSSSPHVGDVGIGVLGAGLFATNTLLPAMKDIAGLTIRGVASAGGVSAQHAASRFGAQYATTDPEAILGDEGVDVVAVLTRHDLHAGQVVSAIKAGKHVFCEKPLCLTTSELDEIRSVLRESDRVLALGFNRRFSPLGIELKEHFGGVDEPLSIHYRTNAGFIPAEHWVHDPTVGGGRIIGEACHFVDFMSFLTGSEPVSVMASSLPDSGRYRTDNVSIILTFSDGSVGTLQYVACGDSALGKERCEVFGGGRSAVLDDYRQLDLVADGRRRKSRNRLRQDKGHEAEWEVLVNALRAGTGAPISFASIEATTLATFAAEMSLQTGEPIAVAEARREGPSHPYELPESSP